VLQGHFAKKFITEQALGSLVLDCSGLVKFLIPLQIPLCKKEIPHHIKIPVNA
jgi:hypothetical protein